MKNNLWQSKKIISISRGSFVLKIITMSPVFSSDARRINWTKKIINFSSTGKMESKRLLKSISLSMSQTTSWQGTAQMLVLLKFLTHILTWLYYLKKKHLQWKVIQFLNFWQKKFLKFWKREQKRSIPSVFNMELLAKRCLWLTFLFNFKELQEIT